MQFDEVSGEAPVGTPADETTNIFLVGMMGAGKSTVGRKLANSLSKNFVDADQSIEERTGVSVSHIFDIEGEAGFRKRESAILVDLCALENHVVATGGGVVMQDENRSLLRQSGWVVYLHSTPQLLLERMRLDRSRPLLQVEDRLGKLNELYAERNPLYCQTAHYVIDSSSGHVNRISRILRDGFIKACQN